MPNATRKEADRWEKSRAYVTMFRAELFDIATLLITGCSPQTVSVILNEKKSCADFVENDIIIAQVVVMARSKGNPDSAEITSNLAEAGRAIFTKCLPTLHLTFKDSPEI